MNKRNWPGLVGNLGRFMALAFFWVVWYRIYAWLNARGAVIGVSWKAPGLYIPLAVYPYFFGGFLMPLLPFYWNWLGDRFFRLLTCYVLASAVSFMIYWKFPVYIDRMTYDGSYFADILMRTITSHDDPANCFPSGHSMFATLGFLGVCKGRAGHIVTWLTGTLAAIVCLTTVLVGQHYWIDIPAGIVTALSAFVFIYSVWRA